MRYFAVLMFVLGLFTLASCEGCQEQKPKPSAVDILNGTDSTETK